MFPNPSRRSRFQTFVFALLLTGGSLSVPAFGRSVLDDIAQDVSMQERTSVVRVSPISAVADGEANYEVTLSDGRSLSVRYRLPPSEFERGSIVSSRAIGGTSRSVVPTTPMTPLLGSIAAEVATQQGVGVVSIKAISAVERNEATYEVVLSNGTALSVRYSLPQDYFERGHIISMDVLGGCQRLELARF